MKATMMMRGLNISIFPLLFLVVWSGNAGDLDPDDPANPHRDPSKCEVCKFVAEELEQAMKETGKNKEVLQIGHQFDKEKKAITYTKSELRLIEALEEVCKGILKLNIHAERSASRRFAKGQSETIQTLRGLQAKGVKVDLGIPDDMWERPSAPVTKMKQHCDTLIEEQEDAISNWFFKTDQETSLVDYLCIQRVLKKDEHECLQEVWTGKEKVDPSSQQPLVSGSATESATSEPMQGPKQPKAKPGAKKSRISRKKVKAGKRGKGKKGRSGKANSSSKSSKSQTKKKDEL
ncbi:protein canopy homolog 4-like [Asterias rubens]|uniref:protein canopy homolog 4-like n=1 Tax=Asterias rubens TaxID=7604 RepID=UPI0014556E41|nr:protein canopy homolog 4-like [Asterias rubens]